MLPRVHLNLRFGLVIAFLALGPSTLIPAAHAQAPDQLFTATPEQLAVTKIVLAQERAWNKGDLDGYLSFFKDAADTQAMLAGPVRGLSNIRTAYHLNFPNRDAMGALENSEVEVRELGPDHALATGKFRLQRSKKAGGPVEGGFTEIFERTAAGWQVIFSETS